MLVVKVFSWICYLIGNPKLQKSEQKVKPNLQPVTAGLLMIVFRLWADKGFNGS